MLISESIGFKIKNLREYLNISQKSLCEGVCSQAYISLVEKGDKNISADILFKLSRRLGVNINFFFEYYESQRDDYIQITMENIRSEVSKRNYTQVRSLIKNEKYNPLFSSSMHVQQFFKWHEGICEFHLGEDRDKALSLMDEALGMEYTTKNNYSERELEILLSKAIIVAEKDILASIEIFEEIIHGLSLILRISDNKIPIRIYYNYSRILTKNKEYEKSNQFAKKGIILNKKHHFMYLLGELYFQIALNYQKSKNFIRVKEYYILAEQVFNILNDEQSKNILYDVFKDIHEITTP
ncbi:helix-turn-helix domain-containing protein [Falsibacillus albus]|uniref:helix-turn-helix domain-containing protein n=1 Tax=Falsibacillus albus TaxID=2478915 RepID=UPI001313EB70|nr:helix-turn-helix domain-containing protein [Falsibacillus albus]